MNKVLLFLITLFFSQSIFAYDISENLKVHGFLTQHLFHSSKNNVYGDSANDLTAEFTEAAVNIFYVPVERVSFSMQLMYRNSGNIDHDAVDLDYGFINVDLKKYSYGQYGLRLGRVKNPVGLYNETRDVAFTTPSIILPQGLYYDRSRALFLSSDGLQFYLQNQVADGDLSIKLNYGQPRNDNSELLKAVIPFPTLFIPIAPQGDLEADGADSAFVGQITYEMKGGETVFAFSYADVLLKYDPTINDPFTAGETHFELYILSAQYNGEKFNLTGEYLYQNNDFNSFGPAFPDNKPVSESWYLQLGYRLKSNWEVYARYGENYLDKDDRQGKNYDLFGIPRHGLFSKDSMIGLRWDINSSVMARLEYHNLNGTSWLTSGDNPVRSETSRYWDLVALQLSLRF